MNRTKHLVLTALFCALCYIGTLIFIPAGPTLGYVHLGDAFVLLSGILLGPISGGLAAALGSTLADLVNGYAIWAPGTFVIKGLSAALAGFLFRFFWIKRSDKKQKKLLPTILVCGVCGELIMVIGYFFYEALFLSMGVGFLAAAAAALLGVPFNLAQALVALVICAVLVPILLRIEDVRNMISGH